MLPSLPSPPQQIWVYGNSFENSLVAVVVPTPAKLQAIAAQVGAKGSVEELCHDGNVKKELLGQLAATAKEGKLKVGWRGGRRGGWAWRWLGCIGVSDRVVGYAARWV